MSVALLYTAGYAVFGSYAAMHAIYWPLCVLLGTPVAQPLLGVVFSQLRDSLTAELKPAPKSHPYGAEWRIRVEVLQSILSHLFLWRPLFGCLLFADRLLLECFYSKVAIKQPLFIVSAGRSGSTTTGQLLDADPTLTGPSMVTAASSSSILSP